jgi:excinuclease ABC subunit C
MGHLLQQVYGDQAQDSPDQVPREVLVPIVPAESEALAIWLGTLRGHRVDLRVPQRGDKRALMDTVRRNAEQSLARHKVARAGDLTTRSQALQELQDALELPDAPLRIECFDVSHVQGTNVVASMVVFEDGLPRKSEYRRFVVRGDHAHTGLDGTQTVDDTAAMHEVLTRRFQRYLDEREHSAEIDMGPAIEDDDGMPVVHGPIDEVTGRPRKFAYPPNLVVVDGGLPQVNAAKSVLDELGIEDVSLVGLAKRLEEVWVPSQGAQGAAGDFPLILPRTSEGLYLLQRVRDEAHRFAITFHRQRRSKAMTTSVLDGIPGLGEVRRKALLRQFGSVKRLRAASVEEIAEVQGISPVLAQTIATRLAADGGSSQTVPAVNVTTGEVLD